VSGTLSKPASTKPGARPLAVLVMAPFLSQVDTTIANVATPAIRTGLAASDGAIELVVGAYLVAFAVLIIPGSRLGQTHGYRRVFLLGVGLFGVTSLLCGLAPNATVLVLTRAAQGAAAAVMFPQALTGIRINFADPARARAIGVYTLALSAGAVLGQCLGGVLIAADVAGLGWRSIFLVNVPVCAAVLVAGARWLPADRPEGAAKVHPPSVAGLSAAVLLVIVPLCLGRTAGWPAWTWLCLAASGPAFWLFLTVQRRAEVRGAAPLLNTRILRTLPVALGLAALFLATSTYQALLFVLAQYIQFGLAAGALWSGLILVPWVAAFGVAGKVTGRLAAVLPAGPARWVAPSGSLLLAGAFCAMSAVLFGGRHPMGALVALLTVGGFGLGIQFSTLIGHLTGAVPARYAPDISGTSTMVLMLGGATGVALYGTLYLTLHSGAGAAVADHAFAVTTLVLGAAALLSATSAYLATHLPGRRSPDAGPSGW
jgi:MFS transporter